MEDTRENKMGVMPVNRLLISMALPMMISMLVQALYNVVDSMFVARITSNEQVFDKAGNLVTAGTDAISALGLAFPVQMLLIAVGTGTGVGVNAIVSKALGEKNQKRANAAAAHGVFLAVCSYIVFLLVGIFLAKTVIRGQGATGRTLEYGTTYLTIICTVSLGFYIQNMFERLLQSTGRTIYTMFTQGTGAIINIILDPILIFGYFGLPKMGVAGAAVATVIGQCVAGVLAVIFNKKKNKDLQLSFKGFRPDMRMIGRIYSVGLPSIIMQAVGSVMNFGMNSIITGINAAGVAVFTVYYKLQSFFFMPLFGMNNGMIPIIAYNYGAQKRSRLIKTVKLSMMYAFCLTALGFAAFQLIPDKLLLLFDTGDPSLLALGVPALRIIAWHYLIAWFCIIAGSMFQALGNGVYSLIVSIARQLVILLPAAYILGKIGGLETIWWAFPLAELMSGSVSLFFTFRINRKIIRNIGDVA